MAADSATTPDDDGATTDDGSAECLDSSDAADECERTVGGCRESGVDQCARNRVASTGCSGDIDGFARGVDGVRIVVESMAPSAGH